MATILNLSRRDFLKTSGTATALVIGAQYDTMDPAHMEWMAGAVQRGRYLYCPAGSHLAMYDDQETYFRGLIDFVLDVDSGRF